MDSSVSLLAFTESSVVMGRLGLYPHRGQAGHSRQRTARALGQSIASPCCDKALVT